MKTLKQIRDKNKNEYFSTATSVPLFTARDVEDWINDGITRGQNNGVLDTEENKAYLKLLKRI